MGAVQMEDLRAELLSQAVGHVLEIGSAIGQNFIYYSRSITSLTTVEPNESFNRAARRSIRHFNFPIDQRNQTVELLTAPDNAFDTVVSTLTLCSVDDIGTGLRQVARVLKPQGKFLFLERSRSSNDDVARWQHKLTPFHRMLGNGSHLDRPILAEIANAGFVVSSSEETIVPRLPRALGNLVYGVASLPATNDI